MKVLVALLAALLLALHYTLWLGEDSVGALWRLRAAVSAQEVENAALESRNAALRAEVMDLKHGLEAVEGRARADLGMVRSGETFYQVIEE